MYSERPSWPLSSYGPAKYEPTIMAGIDLTPEELRVKAWEATVSGNVEAYKAFEASQCAQAEQAMQNILQNIPAALQQFNVNVGTMGNPSIPTAPRSVFGAQPATPSVFGATPSRPVFGQTGFGASTTPTASPSPFGVGGIQPGGGFAKFATGGNQPSAFGSGATGQAQSAFTNLNQQPATPGATSVFGASSSFGARPVFGQTGFGNIPPAPGAPAAPAAGTFPQMGFGASTNPNPNPLAPSGGSVFGPSPFGAGNQNQGGVQPAVSSPFGPQASAQPAFGQTSQMVSPFGQQQQPAAPVSAFAQNAQPQATSAFAQAATTQPTSAFAQAATAQPTSAFAQAAAAQPTSAFARSAAPAAASPFGKQPTSVFGGGGFSQPPKDPFASLLPPNYLEILPQSLRAAFESDEFEWGNIPEWIPPTELR
ncbi:hypothetical protein BOTBODRAFT_65540 [Botryobasidium botryosum FD-172 SS1]|uniref:Uncharacterized protein n=1 Tax=Botryobasidium botryosum (strain FD-172 SS1) TaxID=930990 RepID=A0A067MIX6_BOTB1|nr:hypothetical protein BOTBODRAFT_65540 [Botryobasidium botryosum FD-172 SS1]